MNLNQPKTRFYLFISVCLLGWTLFLTVYLQIAAPVSYKQTDYNPTLFGLRAALNHENPYSQALTTRLQQMEIEDLPGVTPEQLAKVGALYIQPFDYPLAPSLMFAPFSLLPPDLAAFLMRYINLSLYLLSMPLLLAAFNLGAKKEFNRARQNLILVVVLIVALGGPLVKVIWPIIQLSGALLFLMAAIVFCLYRKNYLWAGGLSFLILYKPQTGLPLVADLALFGLLVAPARWQLLKGFGLTAVPLLLIAFWLEPNWVADWLESVRKIAGSTQDFQINYIGSVGLALGTLLGLLLIGLNLWIWVQAARHLTDSNFYLGQALAVGTWVGLAIVPRTGNYDLIFGLIPLLFCLSYFFDYSRNFTRKVGIGAGLTILLITSILYLLLPDRNTVFLITLLASGTNLVSVSYHHLRSIKNREREAATVANLRS